MSRPAYAVETIRPRVRPLRARPGARFQCQRDGFCCRDFYALGPLVPGDLRRLRAFRPERLTRRLSTGQRALETTADGCCVLLTSDGCTLHRERGFREKPRACRRFPYGLVATPSGGRVTTSHRCPNRAIGDRHLVDLAEAERSLVDTAGRLAADRRVGSVIPIDDTAALTFADYEQLERQMIEPLVAGAAPLDAIGAEPSIPGELLQPLAELAAGLEAMGHGPRRVHLGARWCAGALQSLLTGAELVIEEPFWKREYDRIMRRCPRPGSAMGMLADWLADELWSLGWLRFGSLARARVAWTVRLMAADVLIRARVGAGHREDRAAAEAIVALEVLGEAPRWHELVRDTTLRGNIVQ